MSKMFEYKVRHDGKLLLRRKGEARVMCMDGYERRIMMRIIDEPASVSKDYKMLNIWSALTARADAEHRAKLRGE